jgi:transcription antitermination factor NusG
MAEYVVGHNGEGEWVLLLHEEEPEPSSDITIGDSIRLTSGPHAGRIALVVEVGADKPKAELVGKAVEIQHDVTDVLAEAIEVIGTDPDLAKEDKSRQKKYKAKAKSWKVVRS